MDQSKMTREAILQRLESTLEKKRKHLEETERILRERYRENMGEEPKYFCVI